MISSSTLIKASASLTPGILGQNIKDMVSTPLSWILVGFNSSLACRTLDTVFSWFWIIFFTQGSMRRPISSQKTFSVYKLFDNVFLQKYGPVPCWQWSPHIQYGPSLLRVTRVHPNLLKILTTSSATLSIVFGFIVTSLLCRPTQRIRHFLLLTNTKIDQHLL